MKTQCEHKAMSLDRCPRVATKKITYSKVYAFRVDERTGKPNPNWKLVGDHIEALCDEHAEELDEDLKGNKTVVAFDVESLN